MDFMEIMELAYFLSYSYYYYHYSKLNITKPQQAVPTDDPCVNHQLLLAIP